ncbi:MAG: flagellar hook assembly protein FlgD [Pirellulales bacterium]
MDASSISGASSTVSSTEATNEALRNLDMGQFLNLMIAELQNQDPLNPMDNHQILQQIGEIRNIGATEQLSSTLSSVLLGQNVSTASSLIGKNVAALADDGDEISGKVERVSITDGQATLHVGDATVKLTNVREIQP